MFVQVISGRVGDAEGLHRQLDRWVADLQPGATGFLGSTAGVTAGGRAVLFARFESEAAAQANSERPAQGQWWSDTEKYFFEPPTFEDSSDVEEWMGGGSDEAGFLQFMRATVRDRTRLTELDRALEAEASSVRPDLLGGIRVWTGVDTYIEAAYFTSEAEARAGESTELSPELKQVMADYQGQILAIDYFDVSQPWLVSS